MEFLIQNFVIAQNTGQGHVLSATLLPEPPQDDPNRLRRLTSQSTDNSIESDLRIGLLSPPTGVRLSKAEGNAWIDVYVAYFRAADEIVGLAEGYDDIDDASVYAAWKEMTNALIRGYSSGHFHAWTIPCLYVAGRYLRSFAIKADQHARTSGHASHNASMEDITSSLSKNANLEDAARVINRIFQLCISDRYEQVSLL